MKIYRAWYTTTGRWDTTVGYFASKEDAEAVLLPRRTAADPEAGVDEIEIIPASK